MWQSDFTHWRLADGSEVEILNWLDDHSRYLVACTAFARVSGDDVVATFTAAGDTHGWPAATLIDNGADRACGAVLPLRLHLPPVDIPVMRLDSPRAPASSMARGRLVRHVGRGRVRWHRAHTLPIRRSNRPPARRQTVMNNGWDMGSGGGFWLMGAVLLIVGLVILVVWAVNRSSSRGRWSAPPADSSSALDILRERFARGEITEQEFEQAKKTLGH